MCCCCGLVCWCSANIQYLPSLPPLPVNVKWGKEKFDAVELNTEEPPMVFKAQLFALTGVQPDRQKVMVKGGTLKVPAEPRVHTDAPSFGYFSRFFYLSVALCRLILGR